MDPVELSYCYVMINSINFYNVKGQLCIMPSKNLIVRVDTPLEVNKIIFFK